MIEIKRTKAYVVEMSNGSKIKIDQEEVEKVLKGIESGSVIVVKQGIINPSFFINIIQDEDRIQTMIRERRYVSTTGGWNVSENGMQPLGNLFDGTPVGELIGGSKQLGNGK